MDSPQRHKDHKDKRKSVNRMTGSQAAGYFFIFYPVYPVHLVKKYSFFFVIFVSLW